MPWPLRCCRQALLGEETWNLQASALFRPLCHQLQSQSASEAVLGSTAVLCSCQDGFLLHPVGFLLLGHEVGGG